jgi:PKD repeat protein
MVVATIYGTSTPNATKADDGNPTPDGTYTLPTLSAIPAWYIISTSTYSGTVRLSTFGTTYPLCVGGETCNFVFGVNFPPQVSFTWTETMTSPNLRVNFTSHVLDGTPSYSYSWDFGDGHTSDNSNSFNNYASPGNYKVTLRVTDSMGKMKSNTSIVSVAPTNQEPFPVHGLPSWIATATLVGLGVYIPFVVAVSYFFISRERKRSMKVSANAGTA